MESLSYFDISCLFQICPPPCRVLIRKRSSSKIKCCVSSSVHCLFVISRLAFRCAITTEVDRLHVKHEVKYIKRRKKRKWPYWRFITQSMIRCVRNGIFIYISCHSPGDEFYMDANISCSENPELSNAAIFKPRVDQNRHASFATRTKFWVLQSFKFSLFICKHKRT